MPNGWSSELGDGGSPLSGGELQRLALLRALFDDPPFLILDEPSNHLDDAAVATFLHWLGTSLSRPGVLIATHDERIVSAADRVYEIAEEVLNRVR